MKLRRSNEHPRNNPTVAARARRGAALGQNRAAPRIRSSRRRCTRLPYGLAELALVGAVLLSSMTGIRSVGAAQTPSAGSTKETSAAFSNLEKLRLTLALARSYRLTEQPGKALDILTPLSSEPWPSGAIEAEYHDEVARDEEALGRPNEARGELEKAVALDPTAERRFRLSQLAERLGDREEARHQLEAAVAAEPGNTEYKTALAYTLRSSGDLAGAAQLMSGVLAVEPNR